MKTQLSKNIGSWMVALFSLAVAAQELPDAPSSVKQQQKKEGSVFVWKQPHDAASSPYSRRLDVVRQPSYCDLNSMVPVCPGPIRTDAMRPREVGLKKRIILRDGTPIRLRLKETLSSKDLKAGDPVELEVFDEVNVDGVVVVPRFARAWATADIGTRKRSLLGKDVIKFMVKGQSEGSGGKIVLELNGLWAITGETIHLRGSAWLQGDDPYLPADGGLFTLAAIFLVKGEHAVIPKGTKIDAFVDGNTSLDANLVQKIVPWTDHDKYLAQLEGAGKSLVHVVRSSVSEDCSPAYPQSPGDGPLQGGFVKSLQAFVAIDPKSCIVPGEHNGGKPKFMLDGQVVARLGARSFLTMELPAGQHSFETEKMKLPLELKPGSELFIHMFAAGNFRTNAQLAKMGNRDGEDLMFSLKRVDSKLVRPEWRNELTPIGDLNKEEQ